MFTPYDAYSVYVHACTLVHSLTRGCDNLICQLDSFSSSHQQSGKTPVYIATAGGHDDVVQMLIQANADFNEVHTYVCTYVHV